MPTIAIFLFFAGTAIDIIRIAGAITTFSAINSRYFQPLYHALSQIEYDNRRPLAIAVTLMDSCIATTGIHITSLKNRLNTSQYATVIDTPLIIVIICTYHYGHWCHWYWSLLRPQLVIDYFTFISPLAILIATEYYHSSWILFSLLRFHYAIVFSAFTLRFHYAFYDTLLASFTLPARYWLPLRHYWRIFLAETLILHSHTLAIITPLLFFTVIAIRLVIM